MELKGRLKLIADKTPECRVVCDIGTDHAYIPIYLIKNKVCEKAVAVDVRKGPLQAAIDNIRVFRLEESIETRLGDGLEPIYESEADCIIIAGMGGILIKDLLEKDFSKAKAANALILQPMNAVEVVRQWLYKTGFDIYDEALAQEGEKLYNVIVAGWTGQTRVVDEIYYHIGERLEQKRDPLLGKYIRKKLIQVEKIISEMANMRSSENDGMIVEYKGMKNRLEQMLEAIK